MCIFQTIQTQYFLYYFHEISNEKLENHDDKCTSSELMQLITDSSIFIIKEKVPLFILPNN